MATIEELLEELRRNPRHVRFRDADGCAGHILVSRERTVRIMCSKRPGKAIRASISKIVKGSSRHIRFRNCFEQSTLWRC